MTGPELNKEFEPLPQTDPFVVPIEQYESPASRIRGFKELLEYKLQAPNPMLVLGHTAFTQYLTHDRLTPELQDAIGTAFDTIRLHNSTRGAYVGRAFYVPGIDNPNGPRTAGIKDKQQYIREVKKFYQFVVTHKYHTDKDANIALILHPFLSAMDTRLIYGNIELRANEKLPWAGGMIVPHPEPGRIRQMEIHATFGADEAVKSYPTDIYRVDPDRVSITSKYIALKDETTVPVSGSKYDEHFKIPRRFQSEQALADNEIIAVAVEATKVFTKRPAARIEFMVQQDGVYIREIAPWEPEDETELFRLRSGESITGPLIRVADESDIQRIRGPHPIVYFPPEASRRRTTDLFTMVAHTPEVKHLMALCSGNITTAHAVKVIAESGHSIIMVGPKNYPDGLTVKIYRGEDRKPVIEPLDPYFDAIIPLTEVQRLSQGEAGNKVGRLAIMKAQGIPIPDGFAISSQSIKRYLHDLNINRYIALLDVADPDNVTYIRRIANLIQKKILTTPLPISLESQIRRATSQYKFPSYAIRSSGSEDGVGISRAGLYKSSVDVKPEDVAGTIRETIASYYSAAGVIDVLKAGQLPADIIVGVGIHEYIPAAPGTLGAVVFTYPNSIIIETVEGSPESLVSGTAKDFVRITLDRKKEGVSLTVIGSPKQEMTDDMRRSVVRTVTEIEELFKTYQDVELMIRPDGTLWIFQARPR
jgi:hypothetical protein